MSESNKIEEYEAETEELNKKTLEHLEEIEKQRRLSAKYRKETKQNYILLGATVAGAFLFDMKKRNRKLY